MALSIIVPPVGGIGTHLSRQAVLCPPPTFDDAAEPQPAPDRGTLMPTLQIKSQIEHVVAIAFSVTVDDLQRPSRGPAEAAFARQVAMYLAHVCCHWTFTEVGRLFSRDRTTVAHACALVEDHRDDARLDRALDWLERVVKRLAEPRRSGSMSPARVFRSGCSG
jgi:hypothetical protein